MPELQIILGAGAAVAAISAEVIGGMRGIARSTSAIEISKHVEHCPVKRDILGELTVVREDLRYIRDRFDNLVLLVKLNGEAARRE